MMSQGDDDVDAAQEAAVAAYLEAIAAGEQPDRQALAECDPELAAFFDRHDQLAELGSWWRRAAGESLSRTVTLDTADANDAWELAKPKELPSLPGYEVLREIARGGMGIVYEARQASLNRPVAVKIILHGALAGAAEKRRFLAEATAAAKLKHPNIVVIHEVGECAGQPFFSMEYVAGESLSRIVRRQLPTPQQAAHYVAEVARAVQFAHDHGVLHRDIKPSNVLVDESGRVRVMDFGLAKQIDADEQLTVTGQLLGTPSYMAPEQISGSAGDVGPACDVYGLGALLYELLTGQPPFRGANQVETLLAALEAEPEAPRRLRPAVPRALELIALKCLDKDPGARYASAREMAADLNRYLEGESLSIGSPNLLDRVVRTLERSKFDRDVREASRLVMHVAWIALAAHVGVFVTYATKAPYSLAWVMGIRLAGVAAMLALVWPRRAEWFPPRGAAARQLWSIWLGYLAGAAVLFVIDYLTTAPSDAFYGLRAYPPMAVLASLAFFVLGSSYWGYCYVIGGLFLALAVAMTQWLPAAPLAFGVAWAASLALVGRRLDRLARTGR
jgi:serine/threonine protein kinase